MLLFYRAASGLGKGLTVIKFGMEGIVNVGGQSAG